jgi:hypothetical protein
MTVFILSFVVVVLLFVAMSIGVLLGRSPIKGSCGGMSALGLDTECDICGGNPAQCDNNDDVPSNGRVTGRQSLTYDAMSESQRS